MNILYSVAILLGTVATVTLGAIGDETTYLNLQAMTLTERGLSVATESYTETFNVITGYKVKDIRHHLLHYQLPPDGDKPQLVSAVELPSVPKGAETHSEMVIASSADRVVRIRDLSTVIVEKKLYAAGAIELLKPHAAGRDWKVVRSWDKRPFFLSPSTSRLVVKDKDKIQAFDLSEAQVTELQTENLDALFAAAGSRFSDDLEKPEPNEQTLRTVEFGEPPDYLGLTDDLDYGSAHGGQISSRLLYERQKKQTEAVPSLVKLGQLHESASIHSVRKVGDDWRYLGLLWINGKRDASGYVILDRAGTVLQRSPLAANDLDKYPTAQPWLNWMPDQTALLVGKVHSKAKAESLGLWRFNVWRYGPGEKGVWKVYQVDPSQVFQSTASGYTLKSK